MSKHRPVDRIRWQASQKLILNQWRKTNLIDEREKAQQKMLPTLEKVAGKLPEDATVLEIGCGPTCISQYLEKEHTTYLDPLIDDYRRMFPGELPEGEYLPATAEHIKKDQDSYDLIVCLNTISFSLNPELIMHEIERLLKPSGTLILGMRTHTQLEARIHYWGLRMFPRLTHRTRPYYYSLSGIRRTLSRHFTIKEEILQNRQLTWLPMFKRENRLFICSRTTSKGKEKENE